MTNKKKYLKLKIFALKNFKINIHQNVSRAFNILHYIIELLRAFAITCYYYYLLLLVPFFAITERFCCSWFVSLLPSVYLK